MTTVSIVGSSGSIGTQAVDVVRTDRERFDVVALAVNSASDLVVEQALELHPKIVAVVDEVAAKTVASRLPSSIEVIPGNEGLVAVSQVADVVVNGVVGFAGLPVTLAALNAGKRLALANKESLIAGAPVVQVARRSHGAEIVPVDSEHCAIHQCLSAVDTDAAMGLGKRKGSPVSRLLVTASGGPFRGASDETLANISVSAALAHPTWSMGPKITVDSSTLMNKGLEVIEAHELFGIDFDEIDVVVHPQSVIHSMIELVDGTTLAQLSLPDMRLPIGYAMGWPDRLPTAFGAIDWSAPFSLTFEPPDRERFLCLDLAYKAGRAGGCAPAWLNAANEVAVAAFLEERLHWQGIAHVVGETLAACDMAPLNSFEDVLAADHDARAFATSLIARQSAPV
jgi:1-deoxy-D-xylulose-5-phosphate reductoisomerase